MRRGIGTALIGTWVLAALGAGCADDTCQDLGCAPSQRCELPAGEAPGRCLPECEGGLLWDGAACVAGELATCAPLPAPGSIQARCEMEHRRCEEPFAGLARCEGCVDGYVEVDGVCEARRTCSELRCSLENRSCAPTPNARCTGCLLGFTLEGETCRPVKTCAETQCMPGSTCVESPEADAFCRVGDCVAGEAPKATGSGCVRCILDCAGRPGGTGRIYEGLATLADTCICETTPGWFWDEGASGGGDIRPCDEDEDGWVRVTARSALERTEDRAIAANARCELHRVDRFELRNDSGESKEVILPQPVGLYEPERLDDPELLADALAQGVLPAYPGRTLRAEELNTLTKACVWKATPEEKADFNQNGIEDVDEAHLDPALDAPTDPLSPLYDFTYFIELQRGWYEPARSAEGWGRYVIAERSRQSQATGPAGRLALAPAPEDGGDYWRVCERQVDTGFVPGRPGFDFASYADASWGGSGHHSQFRCLRVVASPSGRPNEVTRDEARVAWTMNRCELAGSSPPVSTSGERNPSDPVVSCALSPVPDPRTSTTAPVFFGVSKYLAYDDEFSTYGRPAYVRGCVNTCAEHPYRCPGYDPRPYFNAAQCVGRTADFGALECACGKAFAGAACNLACAGDLEVPDNEGVGHLFTGDLSLAPRAGVWLCGQPAASVAELSGPVSGSTSTWALRGEVPAPSVTPIDSTPLCAPAPTGGCTWQVRATTP